MVISKYSEINSLQKQALCQLIPTPVNTEEYSVFCTYFNTYGKILKDTIHKARKIYYCNRFTTFRSDLKNTCMSHY